LLFIYSRVIWVINGFDYGGENFNKQSSFYRFGKTRGGRGEGWERLGAGKMWNKMDRM